MRRKKKIFRPKRHYKIKRRNTAVIKAVTGIVAVAVLVFVGYSAAGPISRYFESRSKQTETEPWTPENTDITTSADTQLSVSDETVDLTSSQTESVSVQATTSETTVQEAASTEPLLIRSGGAAYSLSPEDMIDAFTLDNALAELAESGCSAVIFPMKTEGGYFNYASEAPLLQTVYEGEPVNSELTAKQISDAATSHGLRPIALVNVLNDNNRYGDYREGSYHTLDDDAWLDTSPDKGGKPWLSPFEQTTHDYMSDIVTELAQAGFKEIICDDFIFPEFRSSDIELLGDSVSPYSERYLALTELACDMTQAGSEAGATVMLRITSNSVIKSYSELFHPEELAGCVVLVDYSENNISRTMVAGNSEVILDDMQMYEKITAVFGEVASQCGDLATVPMLERDSMSADDFSEAVRAITAMGYEKYYVY